MVKTDYSKPDHFTKRAKKAGYSARSVFKLEEIDAKENLLRPGLRVLDLGSSPGSWIQYVSEKIKKKGIVVGVDLNPLSKPVTENQRFVQGDLYEIDPQALKIDVDKFDLVLSDMMAKTIGHKSSDSLRSIALAEHALYVADEVLRPGGNFLVKIFQGAEFQQYREMLRQKFAKVKVKKPKSSRQTSREIYLLALGKK